MVYSFLLSNTANKFKTTQTTNYLNSLRLICMILLKDNFILPHFMLSMYIAFKSIKQFW